MEFFITLVISWIFSTVVTSVMATMGPNPSHHGGDGDGSDPPLPRRRLTSAHEVEGTGGPPAKKKGRGEATGESQHKAKIEHGGTIPIEWDPYDETMNAVGGTAKHLGRVIGQVARHNLPQTYSEWSSMPEDLKESVWHHLAEFFNIAEWKADPRWPKIKKSIETKTRKAYNNSKHNNKKKMLNDIRPNVPDHELEELVEKWQKDALHAKRSAASKRNREKQLAQSRPTGQGSQTMSQVRHNILKDAQKAAPPPEVDQTSPNSPPKPPIINYWGKIGKWKDGRWRDPRFEKAEQRTYEQLIEMSQSVEPGTQIPRMSENDQINLVTQVSRDVFHHSRGWITGVGPSTSQATRSYYRSQSTGFPEWIEEFVKHFNDVMRDVGDNRRFAIPPEVAARPEHMPQAWQSMLDDFNTYLAGLGRPPFRAPPVVNASPSSTPGSTAAGGSSTASTACPRPSTSAPTRSPTPTPDEHASEDDDNNTRLEGLD